MSKQDTKFKTATMRFEGNGNVVMACGGLVLRSAWFEVTPLPDDRWDITFKANEGHEEAIRRHVYGMH